MLLNENIDIEIDRLNEDDFIDEDDNEIIRSIEPIDDTEDDLDGVDFEDYVEGDYYLE